MFVSQSVIISNFISFSIYRSEKKHIYYKSNISMMQTRYKFDANSVQIRLNGVFYRKEPNLLE